MGMRLVSRGKGEKSWVGWGGEQGWRGESILTTREPSPLQTLSSPAWLIP